MATYRVPAGTRVSLVDSQGRVVDHVTNHERIFGLEDIDRTRTTWQTFYFHWTVFTMIVPEGNVRVSGEDHGEGWTAGAVYHQEKAS